MLEATTADRERVEMWEESERRYHAREQASRREGWIRYHLDQAVRLECTAATLAAQHREEAASLREGGS